MSPYLVLDGARDDAVLWVAGTRLTWARRAGMKLAIVPGTITCGHCGSGLGVEIAITDDGHVHTEAGCQSCSRGGVF